MRIKIRIDTDDDHEPNRLREIVHRLNRNTDRLADAVAASGFTPSLPPQSSEHTMANPVIQQLVDAVARNKVVTDSAVILIQGIADRIAAAVAAAIGNGATAEELLPLTTLVSELQAEDDALAAAVAANTPAAP